MADPIDIAFALLKGGRDIDHLRDLVRDKSTGKKYNRRRPNKTTYHDFYHKRKDSMRPTGNLRTGAVPPVASQQDAHDFMRINTEEDWEEDIPPPPLSPIDAMRFAAINSARIGSDYKAAIRMAQAEQMQGKQIQDMFEELGIPVKNTIREDLDRNEFEPRKQPIEDLDDEWEELLQQHVAAQKGYQG